MFTRRCLDSLWEGRVFLDLVVIYGNLFICKFFSVIKSFNWWVCDKSFEKLWLKQHYNVRPYVSTSNKMKIVMCLHISNHMRACFTNATIVYSVLVLDGTWSKQHVNFKLLLETIKRLLRSWIQWSLAINITLLILQFYQYCLTSIIIFSSIFGLFQSTATCMPPRFL